MQNSGLDVELQRTLNELCSDLSAISALDDCNAILQSLALLAETFPQAQSQLGRLLSRKEGNQDRSPNVTFSKLAAIATKFLYRKETSRSAVSLLAALANDNVRNQRRIVQNVTGVKLDVSKYSRARDSSSLYALTVPATVTGTYRRWRKRQRELQDCRLPSGVPPAHDGIPMPCYCDECLGAQQFLSTWQQHFHDLSRWSRNANKDTSSTSNPPSSLSTEDFFRMFLADYQLRICTVEAALGNRHEAGGDLDRGSRHSGLVYYFVSPEEVTVATPRTLVQFDPLRHLSAIAIAPELDVVAVRRAHLQAMQTGIMSNKSPLPDTAEPDTLANDQVILFTSISDLKSCVVPSSRSLEDSETIPSRSYEAAGSNEHRTDFSRFEERHGQLAQCDYLTSEASGEDDAIAQATRELMLDMLAFCDTGCKLPMPALRRSFVRIEQPQDDDTIIRQIESPPLNAKITMTAKLSERVLQITCVPTPAENSSARSFSTCVSQKELVGESKGDLSLLCLSDEALENLLPRCRVCTCDNQESHEETDSVLYLRPTAPEEEEPVFSPNIREEIVENVDSGSGALQNCAGIRLPLPGLSFEVQRELLRLETVVSKEKYRRLTGEGLTAITEKLARIVAGCNERISYLSMAREKGLVRAATEVHRAAAISRCRHCRDLLIQLGKKLALKMKPLDVGAPIPQENLSRVAKLVRTSIHDVLTHSEAFDPWETPDARVERLQLDHRLWASGFPDAAYYHDTDARQRDNRKKQQQLSRKLLLQQQKKKSHGDSKARQRII